MSTKFKVASSLFVVSLFSLWIGNKCYRYFSFNTPPVVEIDGIVKHKAYKDTIECSLHETDGYNISKLEVLLDDKPFNIGKFRSSGKLATFNFDTTTIADGQHHFTINVVDASHRENSSSITIPFFVDNAPLAASLVQHEYRVDQGKTLHIKLQANKPLGNAHLQLLDQRFDFYPEAENSTMYECFIPVDCEAPSQDQMVTVQVADRVGASTTLACRIKINQFEFKKQRGFSVSQEKLDNEREISMSTKALDEALDKWLVQSPRKKMWSGPFEYPVHVQRISTPHGEIRMTPERGKYLHKGIDLINLPRCVVWASQHGKVIIKDRFLMTGNTVVIDHGLGVTTLYAHLEDFADINVGDTIKKGNPVGKLGKTGYATGYHLHFELRVNNVAVDPCEWTERVF